MYEDKNSVKVKIFGNEYTFSGVETEEYISEVCKYLDKKIKKVSDDNPGYSPFNLAVMAGVNISDELFKKTEQLEEAQREFNRFDRVTEELQRRLNVLEKENEYLRQVIESLNEKIEEYES